MDTKWIDFFKELGITSLWLIALLFIIGFLAKKLFDFFIDGTVEAKKSELAKELENFKQSLSTQAQFHKLEIDKTLEEYKNSLQQVSQEHQIRFSKLHADRAETIKTLFSKLVKMEDSIGSFIAPFQGVNEPSADDKARIAATDGNDFLDYYQSNQILFNDHTCEIIDQLNTEFKTAFNKHSLHLRTIKNQSGLSAISQGEDPYFDILKNKIPTLKRKLSEDFRKTLGVL